MAKTTVTLNITGLSKLGPALRSHAADVQRRVEAVVEEYALLIERDAKANAPVDTGDLRSTIRSVLNGVSAEVLAGGIPGEATGEVVEHAAAIEFGLSYSRLSDRAQVQTQAQPYLFPAYEANRAAFVEALRAAVNGGKAAGAA